MTVEDVRNRIQRILAEEMGTVRVNADGVFLLDYESAIGTVRVIDWGDGDTIVKVYSPLLREVPLTPAVYEWVATKGQQSWFAHARVGVSSDDPTKGTIGWEYDLLGNFLDADELMWVVKGVMSGANRLDDELQAQFGGRRAID